MKTRLVISELLSNDFIELKETQQKHLQGGQNVLQIALYGPGSFIFQYFGFQ